MDEAWTLYAAAAELTALSSFMLSLADSGTIYTQGPWVALAIPD